MRLHELLSQSAGRVGHKTAIVDDNVRCSYAELDRKSDRLAAALVSRGLRPDDRVVVFMESSAEAVVTIFAVAKAGGVFTPIDPATSAERLAFVLDNSRAVGVITQARLASVAAAAMREASTVRLVVLAGGDRASMSESCLSFEDVVNRVGPLPAARAVGADRDPGMLLYVNGTGEPLSLTHEQIVTAANAASDRLFDGKASVVLRVQPRAFARGLYRLLAAVRVGATLVIEAGTEVAHGVAEGGGDRYLGGAASAG